jgi:hypothetical protein
MAKRPQNREEKAQRAEQKERESVNQKILNDQLREAGKILDSILEKEDVSLENYADKLQLSAQLTENAKTQASIIKKIFDLENSTVKNADILKSRYDVVKDLVGNISQRFAEVVQNSATITSDSFTKVDITQEYNDLLDQEYELDELRDKIGKKEYDRLKEMLNLAKEKLDTINDTNKSQEIANKLALNYLSTNTLVGASTKRLLHGIESFQSAVGTGSLGVIGDVLGTKAAHYIESIESDIHGKLVKAFQESGESAITAFAVAKTSFASFIAYALPALGILGILGIFGFIIHEIKHLDEEFSELGKTIGVSRREAELIKIDAKSLAAEMKIVNINSKEVGEAMGQTVGILNGLNIGVRMAEGSEATKQLIKDLSVLGTTFGITDSEAGGLTNMSNFAVIMSKSMGQVVKESLKLGKGLLTTKAAIMVVGKISPSIAIAFKKGSVELLKAAQRAKLLGIELDDVADFGDKLLEIESSLEAEMTARVITGRQLNFDMARQYALQGDIASLQSEMLNQLGSMAEFQKMNRLQQKYMSDAFGMTVDEVAKLLAAQEKLVELGIDQTKMDELQTLNAAELADEIKKTNNEKLKGYLQTLAKEKESASINERINDFMTKIREKIAGTLIPLLQQAHHFLDSAKGAEFLDSIVKAIYVTFKAIVPVVKFLAENMWILGAALGAFVGFKALKGIGAVVSLFKGMGTAAQVATPAVDALTGATGDLAKQMGTATDATSTMTQAVGGTTGGAGSLGGFVSTLSTTAVNMAIVGVGLVAFAGALWISAKAFQEFAKVNWKDVGLGISSIITMGLVAVGFATGAKAILIGAGVLALLSIAVATFGDAITRVGEGIKASTESIGILADGFKKLKNIGDLSSVGGAVKKGLESIVGALNVVNTNYEKFGKLKEAIKQLGIDKLVEFGELAKVDLGKAADNIVAAINSFSKVTIDAVDFGSKSGFVAKDKEWFGLTGFVKKAGTGLIGGLEQLNKAMGELELDNIEGLAKIASTDMSKLGQNVEAAIKSLASINVGDAVNKLTGENGVASVFSSLRDALEDYNIFGSTYSNVEGLGKIAELDIQKLKDNTFLLKDVVWNLSQIGMMKTSGLDLLSEKFIKLSEALENLNIEKLKDLSNVNVESLKNLSATFQQPVAVGTTGGSQAEDAKTNQKLDKVISVLENIFATSNQPVVIKIGDRTIETIGEKIQLMGSYSSTLGATGRTNKIRG